MGVQAYWHGRTFEVSPVKVSPVKDLATAFELDEETNTKNAQSVTFSVTVLQALGVDVMTEIDAWGNLVGTVDALYIGGKQFGPRNMKLNNVTPSNILLDADGRMLSADLAFTFKEDRPNSKSTTSTVAKSSGTSSVAFTSQTRAAALSAKPSTQEKVTKKPATSLSNTTGTKKVSSGKTTSGGGGSFAAGGVGRIQTTKY